MFLGIAVDRLSMNMHTLAMLGECSGFDFPHLEGPFISKRKSLLQIFFHLSSGNLRILSIFQVLWEAHVLSNLVLVVNSKPFYPFHREAVRSSVK